MVRGHTIARPMELSAYILCGPGADSTRVLGQIHDDPVLAVRHVGLGRSASLAVSLASDSPDFAVAARLAGAVIEWASVPLVDPRFTGELRRDGGRSALHVTAFDGDEPINGLALTALTIGDAGASLAERRALEQIAPGRYEAPLTTARAGRWLAVVDEQGRRVWQGPMIQRAANEFDAIGPDWQAMEQLARLTGGRIVRSPDAKSLSGAVVAAGDVALWPILLGAALLLALAAWLRLRGQLAPGAVGDRNRR